MAVQPPQERALATMRRWLADGTIPGGVGMPGEVALADRLGVARGTVRKVLTTLAGEGLVGPRRRGRRVRGPGDPASGDQAVVLIGAGAEDRGLSESQEGAVEDACLRALHRTGRPLLLVDHALVAPERALAALGRRPFGVICTQFAAIKPAWRAQLPQWRAAGIPVVVHGPPEDHPGFDCVYSDHEAGAHALTRALIARGRRRLLQVWHAPERPRWLRQREAGHARAMAEAGLTPLPAIFPPEEPPRTKDPDPANLEQRMRAYLGFLYAPLRGPEPPDALIALNDANAVAIALACRELGKRVHEDIAVAGFDGTWAAAWDWEMAGMAPFLTTTKHNHAVGEMLATTLLERCAGRIAPVARAMPIDVVEPEA